MKVSVIMPVCNQGNEARLTVQSAKEALGGLPHEIICVDDHSLDSSCHDLPSDVLVVRTRRRGGVSAARRKGRERATGDMLVWCDPHCRFPRNSFEQLVETADETKAIVQPLIHSVTNRKDFRTGMLALSERCLRVQRSYLKAPRWPALYGTVYAVRADVYDKMGGWPLLPGIWGCSEQALTLMSWFSKVKIVVREDIRCIHKNQPNKKFPFSVHRHDPAMNFHYVHAAFFPRSYDCYWRPILAKHHKWSGYLAKADEVIQSKQFKKFAAFVEKRRVRTEEQFFRTVLGIEPPDDIKLVQPRQPKDHDDYVRLQEKRSRGREHKTVRPRVKRALNWLKQHANGGFKGSALDLGTRDGFGTEYMKTLGMTETQGIDLSRKAVEYAQSVGRHVSLGDMMKLEHLDNMFDVVVAQHSLEHVPEPHKAVSEMFRVLKPGGIMLIVVPKEGATNDRAHHSIFPNISAVCSLVSMYGDVDEDSVVTEELCMSKGLRELLYTARKKVCTS